LFIELGADDEQLDFPVVYASAREGYALYNLNDDPKNLEPLFETLINHIPAPKGFMDKPLQLLYQT